jgi:hypothetical protein
MDRKTTRPATAPVEKKKTGDRRIETARVEWEKRQARMREASAVEARAIPPVGKKTRGKRRRKVWQMIASGRVGNGNGAGDVIDLRSPSRSPSIECMTPQAGPRRNFTLTPDTTVPSTSRSPSPGDGISDIAISSLHHLTASLASGSKRTDIESLATIPDKNLDFAARQTPEEAVVGHHHSTSTYPTPHASRETSEEAIVIHHHDSVSSSVTTHVARGVSEKAIIKHHNNPPISRATRGTSEEAVIIHHHISPSSQTTRQASEETVTAYHHISVSMSPTPSVSRDTSEEAIIAHHHSSPTPSRSQIIQNTPDASPISDGAITEYHHHASASVSPSSLTSRSNTRQLNTTELTDPVKSSKIETDKAKSFKSDSLSDRNGTNSLLRPFAYPVSTPLPSPPLTPTVKQSIIVDPFFQVLTQDEKDVSMNADVESKDEYLSLQEPFVLSTPPRSVSISVQAFNEPITPSRLGPSWKTETAPQSVIDEEEEEVDELESDSEEDQREIETLRLSQLRLDSPLSFGPSLSQEKVKFDHGQDIDMDDSNTWAFEHGIDPRQWDETLTKSPTQIIQDGADIDHRSEADEGYGNVEEGSSSEDNHDEDTEEEDDEDVVEGECGYRVFAGFTDLQSIKSAQCDNRNQTTTSPGSSIKSFGSLTPRRPTALEATTGGRYGRHFSGESTNSASPGSSTGRVSAELGSPSTPLSQARDRSLTSELSPSYLFDSKFRYESINSTPDRQRGSVAGGNMPKRDQVILALLQAGHVTLAEDILRGDT